ncbi:MAG: class II aldolase/adducin family protein [Alphaproteobacteria bacterium]|nr:class II aldolase/adducin family protein [Alphaproteobacteria bacterium]HPF47208.1 class II aldolase/adducin family protein [Emcibacteraceae bacterium]HRW28703.1 class II aldolase/adducin family protein [Emcibacteraceae bacterium]
MIKKDSTELRQSIIDACLWMNSSGLNQGTSGNISIRVENGVLITPSSMAYEDMEPEDIMLLPGDGLSGEAVGKHRPSSEWKFHVDIYHDRKDINSVVHTHSTYATALSMLRRDIPSVHYMIGVFGGDSIRCADYAHYGSAELSKNALVALKDRTGCLLGTHGMIACGGDLKQALWRAGELEALCQQYHLASQLGEPHILSKQQMVEVRERMKSGYGIWPKK